MAKTTTWMGRRIKTFDPDIKTTSDYIIALCPPPADFTNGLRLGWTPDEILQWCDYRSRWDILMVSYDNKKGLRTTEVIDGLNLIIKEAVAYDKAHNLYNRVAVSLNAVTADFEAFNIIRGTPLAASTHARAAEPGTKRLIIGLKSMGHLFHQLLVTSPDKKGRGMEEGVSEILFYKAVTAPAALAPAFEIFQHIGGVTRGVRTVTHTDADLNQKAWYIACVKNSRGEIGVPSDPVGFIIM